MNGQSSNSRKRSVDQAFRRVLQHMIEDVNRTTKNKGINTTKNGPRTAAKNLLAAARVNRQAMAHSKNTLAAYGALSSLQATKDLHKRLVWMAKFIAANAEDVPDEISYDAFYARLERYVGLPIIKRLLTLGANPNAMFKDPETDDMCHVLPFLISHVIEVDAYISDKRPKHLLENLVEAVLDAGANPNAVERGQRMPLVSAVDSGLVRVVRLLLDHGADPNTQSHGQSVLHMAMHTGGKNAAIIARLLHEKGGKAFSNF